MHVLGELLEIDQTPEIDSWSFRRKEYVHLYRGVPIKAAFKEAVGDDKF